MNPRVDKNRAARAVRRWLTAGSASRTPDAVTAHEQLGTIDAGARDVTRRHLWRELREQDYCGSERGPALEPAPTRSTRKPPKVGGTGGLVAALQPSLRAVAAGLV